MIIIHDNYDDKVYRCNTDNAAIALGKYLIKCCDIDTGVIDTVCSNLDIQIFNLDDDNITEL